MSKLRHFIALLSKKEVQLFKEFLRSPFHNKDAAMLPLFEAVMKEEDQAGSAAKESSEIRKAKSGLLQLVMKFLSFRALEGAGALRQVLLLRELNARGEQKYFAGVYKTAKKTADRSAQDSEMHYDQLYALEVEMNKHCSKQAGRSQEYNLERVAENLEKAILVRKLKYSYLGANVNRLQGKEHWAVGTDTLVESLQGNMAGQDLLIRLFYYHLMTLVRPDEDSYFGLLLQELKESIAAISLDDAIDLYTGLMNSRIRKINAGQKHYERDLMALYKQVMQQGIFVKQGQLPPFQLKNMVSLGARLGEFNWASRLVATYATKIKGDAGKNSDLYNRGIIAFYQGNYSTARSLLNKVVANFEDVFYGLDARVFLLRIYYECEEMDLTESACHAFRIYLYRLKGIGAARKKNYGTFIRFYRRICVTAPTDQRKWEKLFQEISDAAKIPVKNWLLEKVQEKMGTG